MDEFRKYLIESCQRELDYYDVVDEGIEGIDYEMILDVMLKAMRKFMRQQLLGGE